MKGTLILLLTLACGGLVAQDAPIFTVSKPLVAVARENAGMYADVDRSQVQSVIEKGQTVLVKKWAPFVLYVETDSASGYVLYTAFSGGAGFDSLVRVIRLKSMDLEKQHHAARAKAKHDDLVKQFGTATAERIERHEYWIGMAADMASESLGVPDQANRAESVQSVTEQWVYREKNLRLYFKDGILIRIQLTAGR